MTTSRSYHNTIVTHEDSVQLLIMQKMSISLPHSKYKMRKCISDSIKNLKKTCVIIRYYKNPVVLPRSTDTVENRQLFKQLLLTQYFLQTICLREVDGSLNLYLHTSKPPKCVFTTVPWDKEKTIYNFTDDYNCSKEAGAWISNRLRLSVARPK